MPLALLKSRFPEIIAELPSQMGKVTLTIAEAIASEAASSAPVDTGRLRDSLEAKPTGPESAAVRAVFYYFMVEFGTQYQGARPFLLPAVEMLRGATATVARAELANL